MTDPDVAHNTFTHVDEYKSLVHQTSQHYDVIFKITERYQTVDTMVEQVSKKYPNTKINCLVLYGHGSNDSITLAQSRWVSEMESTITKRDGKG